MPPTASIFSFAEAVYFAAFTVSFYTRYGDCLARISEYILLLSVLYYVAYRYKRRNHLVK